MRAGRRRSRPSPKETRTWRWALASTRWAAAEQKTGSEGQQLPETVVPALPAVAVARRGRRHGDARVRRDTEGLCRSGSRSDKSRISWRDLDSVFGDPFWPRLADAIGISAHCEKSGAAARRLLPRWSRCLRTARRCQRLCLPELKTPGYGARLDLAVPHLLDLRIVLRREGQLIKIEKPDDAQRRNLSDRSVHIRIAHAVDVGKARRGTAGG